MKSSVLYDVSRRPGRHFVTFARRPFTARYEIHHNSEIIQRGSTASAADRVLVVRKSNLLCTMIIIVIVTVTRSDRTGVGGGGRFSRTTEYPHTGTYINTHTCTTTTHIVQRTRYLLLFIFIFFYPQTVALYTLLRANAVPARVPFANRVLGFVCDILRARTPHGIMVIIIIIIQHYIHIIAVITFGRVAAAEHTSMCVVVEREVYSIAVGLGRSLFFINFFL